MHCLRTWKWKFTEDFCTELLYQPEREIWEKKKIKYKDQLDNFLDFLYKKLQEC